MLHERVGLFSPGLNVITGGVADRVRQIDPDLVTVWNARGGRYEIYDRAAPGGPKWQLVLRVQEPDGSYRPLDARVLAPLYESRGRDVMDLISEMERKEEQQEREIDKRTRALGEDLYEIAWALGKRVVPKVDWRERTPPEVRNRLREQIRSAATPAEVAVA